MHSACILCPCFHHMRYFCRVSCCLVHVTLGIHPSMFNLALKSNCNSGKSKNMDWGCDGGWSFSNCILPDCFPNLPRPFLVSVEGKDQLCLFACLFLLSSGWVGGFDGREWVLFPSAALYHVSWLFRLNYMVELWLMFPTNPVHTLQWTHWTSVCEKEPVCIHFTKETGHCYLDKYRA